MEMELRRSKQTLSRCELIRQIIKNKGRKIINEIEFEEKIDFYINTKNKKLKYEIIHYNIKTEEIICSYKRFSATQLSNLNELL